MPGVMSPEPPCQEMVQPPDWLPRSSALEPATYTLVSAARGSRSSAFLSSTCDFAAASRATARCAADPTSPASDRSANGASNSPSANFWVRIRRTASSTRSCDTSPEPTLAVIAVMNAPKLYGAIAMSRPAFTERAALSA